MENNSYSRRSFIKLGSIFCVGNIIMHDITAKALAESLHDPSLLTNSAYFSIEILRPDDLLYLKYYFFNAVLSNGQITPESGKKMQVYVRIPALHIAEELYTENYRNYTDKKNFKKTKAFLANNSLLGATYKDSKRLQVSIPQLLNWEDKFRFTSLDDLRKAYKDQHTGFYEFMKTQFREDTNIDPGNPELYNDDASQALTLLEVPYKIWLTPIAPPDPNGQGNFSRLPGEHVFESNNDIVSYIDEPFNKQQVKMVSVWENSLVFRSAPDQKKYPPRFKVIKYKAQGTYNEQEEKIAENWRNGVPKSDGRSDLLPAPIDRDALHHLTMQPDYDRDVYSDYFKISALGASGLWQYRNDNPERFALIAWLQEVKYARDNRVAVTYRGIDYFTALKLEVSIITNRDFKLGTSFLPKLYFVSYSDPDKNYISEEVRSRLPYTKITPLSKGTLFTPKEIAGSSYEVKDNDTDQLIEFEYEGIDKDGATIKFKSKMVIIMAETFEIETGRYTPPNDSGYGPNDAVPIMKIGYLNPRREKVYNPDSTIDPFKDGNANGDYRYKTKKFFSAENQVNARTILNSITSYINQPDKQELYTIFLNKELTFARLKSLKDSNLISSGAKNATFKTLNLRLNTALNEDIFTEQGDLFRQPFPILPGLLHANVVLTQLDLIDGKSMPRKITYYEHYYQSKMDIDDAGQQTTNPSLLFLQINDDLKNFFQDNYRRSGAVCNPGVKFTHISALDAGPVLNEQNNVNYPKFAPASSIKPLVAGTRTVDLKVNSNAIFRELDANVLGIPLAGILENVLPLDDIPNLTSLKDFKNLDWRTLLPKEQRDLLTQIETEYYKYKNEFKNYERILKTIEKGGPQKYFEKIVEQISRQQLAEINAQFIAHKTEATQYITNVLMPIYNNAIIAIPDLNNRIDNILRDDSATQLVELIDLYTTIKKDPRQLKDAVKAYICNKAITAVLETDTATRFLNNYATLNKQIKDESRIYADQINAAVQEAMDFSEKFQQGIIEQASATINSAIEVIIALFSDTIKIYAADINGWITQINQLLNIYNQYYQLYKTLKKEYYEDLYKALNLSQSFDTIYKQTEKLLIRELQTQINSINPSIKNTDVKKKFDKLKSSLTKLISDNPESLLSNFETLNTKELNEEIFELSKAYLLSIDTFNKQYNQLIQDYNKAYAQYLQYKKDFEQILNNPIQFIEDRIQDLYTQLQTAAEQEVDRILQEVRTWENAIEEIRKYTRQSLKYKFTTKKFKQTSFAGIIEFLPFNSQTSLTINSEYVMQLYPMNIGSGNPLMQQSYLADCSLTNFKIGILGLLYVHFDEVRFSSGTNQPNDFQVKIRTVDFSGFLGFFSALSKFFKSLGDNFSFSITTEGVMVAFLLKIPDIPAGAFNLFNLNQTIGVRLPFNPKKSLEIIWGIGTPEKKFGVTVSGIFGGQGYCMISATPKDGIVAMEFCLEFGAIFNLDLTVARGSAYLVGGIYIRKFYGVWDLRGYILCSGSLNILGIFSASLTFYLGLQGNSEVLKGVCTLNVSYKLGPFFEISVNLTFEKTIAGAKSANSQGQQAFTNQQADKSIAQPFEILESNTDQEILDNDDELYLIIKSKTTIQNPYLQGSKGRQYFTPQVLEQNEDHTITWYRLSLENIPDDTYDIYHDELYSNKLNSNKRMRKGTAALLKTDDEQPPQQTDPTPQITRVSRKEYYASYYKNY